MLPEKYAVEPYVITTSPVVLGGGGTCDIVLDDPSVAPSHIQFVLLGGGRFLEVYNLADAASNGASGGETKTLLNGEPVDKIKIKAQHDKFYTLRVGGVSAQLLYGPIKTTLPSDRNRRPSRQKSLWFVIHDGKQYGPMAKSELSTAIRDGKLAPLDDAWKTGMEYRIKAFEIPGLFDRFITTRGSHRGLSWVDSNASPEGEQPEGKVRVSIGDGGGSSYHASVFREGDLLLDGRDTRRCPNCWYRFPIESLCYISRHPQLMGDPVLGSEDQRRFLPREFMPVRRAVDSRGEICTEMACPRCHLRIPTPFLDTTPIFLSIIGTPGSGKSYYLAGATWMLRKMLPRYFGITFEDVDNVTNAWLNSYEEALFFPVDGDAYHVIEKTQIEAVGLSKQVKINDITLLLPQPAMFTLLARDKEVPSSMENALPKNGNGNDGGERKGLHSRMGDTGLRRTLAVYDNAGEHFQTGQDVIEKPGTLHMLHAHGLLFLFDPTADPRFEDLIALSDKKKIVQTLYQQQKILIETIDRIRKYSDLNVTQQYRKPVVVGLSKVDLLSEHLTSKGIHLDRPPLKWIEKGVSAALDSAGVGLISSQIRTLFYERAPEYVNTIESFAADVVYLPVSAIGHQPDQRGVAVDNVHPIWVEVPFLHIFSRMGVIPS